MINILIGSEGIVGTCAYHCLKDTGPIYTFDISPNIHQEEMGLHFRLDATSKEFIDKVQELLTKHPLDDFNIIYTPAIDYPVRANQAYDNHRFSESSSSVIKGLTVSFLPLYTLIQAVINKRDQDRVTFIAFDSIYSTYLPKYSFYESGIKPIAYSISKAPLEILFKAYASDYSTENNKSRSYILKLSTVESKTLTKSFTSKFKKESGSFSLVSESEIAGLIKYLLREKPLSLSGTVLKCTCGFNY